MKKALITNIQRFSLHDGPGIRTTVFLKGCSLHCPWCANPENIFPHSEEYVKDGEKGIYGKYFTCDEIYKELVKDKIFYAQPDYSEELGNQRGGITFSGGEPLLQFDALEPLLRKLKDEDIHICSETCLFVPMDKLSIALKYVDIFYVDIKILDGMRCKEVLGGDIDVYYAKLDRLFDSNKLIVFRIPIIGGYTNDDENICKICNLLMRHRPKKVELIKGHNLGDSKYISLDKEPIKLDNIADEEMENIKRIISDKTGISIEICKV